MKTIIKMTKQLTSRLIYVHKREINVCGHALFGGMLGMAVSSSALALGPSFNSHTGLDGNPTNPTADSTLITQMNNPIANIEWNHFNTDQNHVVTFRQGGSNFTAINRVAGAQTKFHGTLKANGRVVLINQNGFLFGPTSSINVGSFMATTNGEGVPSDLSDFESWVENHTDATKYATIINEGKITITENGGFAILLAPFVRNDGTIRAAKGVSDVTIGLGTLNAPGTERKGIENTGTLRARSGYVAMVNKIFNAAVNVGGIVDVDTFARRDDGGTILVASKGDINLQGAKFTARGGRDVEVRLKADNDILSNDAVTSFKLKADGLGVKANLDMEADGVIDILTDASVVAEGGFAEAEFDVEGKLGVSITTGNDTILVKAIADGKMGKSGDAYADADLDIDSKGDIEVNGHMVVKAKANAAGRGSAGAYADVEIGHEWMADKIVINGDMDVTAKASNRYYRRSMAEAVAYSSIMAGGKDGEITFIGDLNVKAKSRGAISTSIAGGMLLSSGDINYNGDVDINAKSSGRYATSMAGGLIFSDGNINYTGDLNIEAKSRGLTATSLAGGLLLSSGDLVYNGDSNVNATAKSRGRGSDAISVAGLIMLPGLNIGGYNPDGWISPSTLTVNGDVLVDAKASAKGPDSMAFALGLGILAAGGDVNIDADSVIVNSTAIAKGRKSRATSLAGLITFAGLDVIESFFSGGSVMPANLNIVGDLEANSIAQAPKDRRERAIAANVLLATGDITIRGADPLASANESLVQGQTTMFEVCGDDGIGCFDGPGVELMAIYETWVPKGRANSYAQLIIEAGGTVDIQPKPETETDSVVTGPNELFAFRGSSKPSGATGNQPLRITNNGDMLAATGFGVTQPPPIQVAEVNNIDVEAAILAGADPAALLPPTAAGGVATAVNDNDTMTSPATPDFCDRLVSGACYE